MFPKPLEGIRVVDLTRVLAGPFCTMILEDLGAEVIKIEKPQQGDDARHFGPFLDEDQTKSSYFISLNSGKKSVALDIRHRVGKEILTRLIKCSDVLVENYRPGTLAKLGFSDSTVKALNPNLILTSISGFGHTGPESQNAAYDMIIQGLSGIMSITGTEDGRRVRVGTSISDIVTGLYAVIGILGALYRQKISKISARPDIAMLDSTISILENAIARSQLSDIPPGPLGTRHPSITPFETYRTRDAEIIIAVGNDKMFTAFCDVIGKPELVLDARFRDNMHRTQNFEALRHEINSVLATADLAVWLKRLKRRKIPCAKVNDMRDLFAYDQVKARNMLVAVEGEKSFRVAGSPLKFSGEADIQKKGKPPTLGEHNEEILIGLLGYSRKQVEEMYSAKVLSK